MINILGFFIVTEITFVRAEAARSEGEREPERRAASASTKV